MSARRKKAPSRRTASPQLRVEEMGCMRGITYVRDGKVYTHPWGHKTAARVYKVKGQNAIIVSPVVVRGGFIQN